MSSRRKMVLSHDRPPHYQVKFPAAHFCVNLHLLLYRRASPWVSYRSGCHESTKCFASASTALSVPPCPSEATAKEG